MDEQQKIEDLQRKLDAALRDLLDHTASICESCLYCKHYHECQGKECDWYSGGSYCMLQPHGDCKKLVNTPCHGCDYRNHWEWRGVTDCG